MRSQIFLTEETAIFEGEHLVPQRFLRVMMQGDFNAKDFKCFMLSHVCNVNTTMTSVVYTTAKICKIFIFSQFSFVFHILM